jgi:hypothetical protein
MTGQERPQKNAFRRVIAIRRRGMVKELCEEKGKIAK